MYQLWRQLCAYGLVLLTTLLAPASAQGPGDRCQALSGYMEAHPQCLVLGYCREVECLLSDTDFVATLSVRNCEDPVRLILRVLYDGSGTDVTNTFYVMEREEGCTFPVELDEPSHVYVSFSRNESHVHFRAETVYQGDNFLLVPAISIPLDPLNCTCEDIQDAVTNIQFPIPGIQDSCDMETADSCYESHCDISYPGTTLHTVSVIDPCAESLEVTVFNGSSHQHQVFQETYTQSRSFPVSLGGFDATVSVNINHYNYSMSVSVDVTISALGSTVTLLPEQQIILDRSSCTPFQAFPARGADRCPRGSNFSTPATPTQGGPNVAVAVGVPVFFMVLGLTVAAIAVVVVLVYFKRRKNRSVPFRRIGFDQMDNEEET